MISDTPAVSDRLWCVVPAAGIGQRMKADVPKQYLSLANKTVIEHTLEKLLLINNLAGIVVALHAQDTLWPSLPIAQHRHIHRVVGGGERCDSVLSALIGLENKAKDSDWILVHDAARPCVSVANIEAMVSALSQHDVGGILALPVSDTLKKANGQRIEKTISRENMWQAQTPQMFRYGLLKKALLNATARELKAGSSAESLNASMMITDEASAIESLGYVPQLVLGERDNIKITEPDDLWLAEMILQKQASQ